MSRMVEYDYLTACAKEHPLTKNNVEFFKSLKTVDAESVVHGHWIYDHWCEFKCSNCGYWSNSQPYKGREKYCPNCGVKMEKGDEYNFNI